MRYATTAARNVVSFSALIGPFEFERECERRLNLSTRSNSNGPIRVENETTLRAAVVARPCAGDVSSQGSQESGRGEF